MSIIENIIFYADTYGLDRKTEKEKVERLINMTAPIRL